MEVEKSTLGSMKQVAKKSQTYDQLINQRITCNACHEKGSIEIHVKAGKFGVVTLFVCTDCIGKFTDRESKAVRPDLTVGRMIIFLSSDIRRVMTLGF